jgi:hypothetical protein
MANVPANFITADNVNVRAAEAAADDADMFAQAGVTAE